MLDIIIQLDISARLTLQIRTIICHHHMTKVLLKEEKIKKIQKYEKHIINNIINIIIQINYPAQFSFVFQTLTLSNV